MLDSIGLRSSGLEREAGAGKRVRRGAPQPAQAAGVRGPQSLEESIDGPVRVRLPHDLVTSRCEQSPAQGWRVITRPNDKGHAGKGSLREFERFSACRLPQVGVKDDHIRGSVPSCRRKVRDLGVLLHVESFFLQLTARPCA